MSEEQKSKGFTGETHGEAGVPFMSIQDIFGMGIDRQIITIAGFQYPILGHKVPYYTMKRLSGRYDSDPFHA